MPPVSISPAFFFPSASLRGVDAPAIFRGRNVVIRGDGEDAYLSNYEGSLDLGETYNFAAEALTGTLSWIAGESRITGDATLFTQELRTGQMILAGAEVLCVRRVIDDRRFIADRAPTTTVTVQTARFLRVIFEINRQRGSLVRGNGIKIDKGDLLIAGIGAFYLNGIPTGFTGTRKPKRLQRANDGTLAQFPLGFEIPPPVPTVTAVAGGTKKMMDGKYSFLVSYYNSRTKGFSNPSPVIKQNGSAVDLEIDTDVKDAAKTRFQFDFTACLAGKPANADGFIIWGNPSGGGVAETNASLFNNGPWSEAAKVLISDLDGDHKGYVEYLDSELGAVASGDNDAPPDCEFLAEFSNVPFFISALGNTTVASPLGASPGNYVVPTKNSNREAAPYAWRTSVGDEITGFALGVGRLFCQTTRGVPFVTPTGNTEIARLAPTLADYPFTSRPFWTKGGISPYNITVVQGDVFAFTGGQPLMSPRGTSDSESRPFELGGKIRDLIKDWTDGYAVVCEDPKNQQICFFQAATRKNAAGFWESDILPFDLQKNVWLPPIVLSSQTGDRIVTSACIVENRLEFLAGGRTAGGGFELRTYRYDERGGEPVSYYIATPFSDFGIKNAKKKINWQQITGRYSTLTMQFFGADSEEKTMSVGDLEKGENPLSGNIVFTGGGAEVEESLRKKHLTKNIKKGAMRISGTWDGTGEPDRIDEIVISVEVAGRVI